MSQHENDALQVQGDRVVLGEWSGDLEELIAKNVELRQMLREGRCWKRQLPKETSTRSCCHWRSGTVLTAAKVDALDKAAFCNQRTLKES